MTAYTPDWRIKVNGSTLTNTTLANLNITSGRTNIYEQARAGYANLSLIQLTDVATSFDINDPVTIELKNTSGTYVPIFGGFITEFDIAIANLGSVTYTQTINILALGALARLPRTLTDGVLVKAFDGTQIYSILEQVLFAQWQQVPAATTWANYNATQTWAGAENTGLGEIDTPGDYELHARAASTTDVYSLVSALASSGLGYIYENANGQICYADSTHRSQYLAANGYVDLDALQALGAGFRTATRGGDVRNAITIGYKNGQEVSDSDLTSIGLYGLLEQKIDTTLENVADATTQAAFYLDLRAYPQAIFDSITFNLANPEIDNADRNSLINVFMGMPVNITGLPLLMGSNFQGFVEGWRWQASYNSVNLTLTMTPIAYSLQAFRWNSVPVVETWNTIDPTLIWLDATVVA